MLDRRTIPPTVFTVKINCVPLRFVLFDEPNAVVWMALGDALACARYPRALKRKLLKQALIDYPNEHRVIELQERPTFLIHASMARVIGMSGAFSGFCPDCASDIFEVVSAYAQDKLLSREPPECADLIDELLMKAGK